MPTAAQTPPRPAVDLRQLPTMLRSVLPADFNRDGRIDLVAGEPGATFFEPGRVVVRAGNGNGTFGAPAATGLSGIPVVVADFNGDTFEDVIVSDNRSGSMSILPGRGNGTFQAPRSLDPVSEFRFALGVDMNADGRRDLVLGHGTTVEIQPGLGDFTFGPTMVLPAGRETGPSFAITARLNNDDRPDLVVAQAHGSVMVYLNNGGLLFSPTEIVVADDDTFGVAAGDLDADGDQDLIVPHSTGQDVSYNFGGVEVFLNRGNGTFGAPVSYVTGLQGSRTVATGDFNRDGRLDVAIGGRSHGWNDLSDFRTYWDSISIFPGRGNGTLAPAALFRLDSVPDRPDFTSPYVDQHHALTTADIDRDGHTDLVASPGAVVLNRPAAANRAPVVQARADPFDTIFIVSVNIVEPDSDWLQVEWRQDGVFRGNEPSFEFSPLEDTTLVATVTDVRGGVGTASVFIPGVPGHTAFVRILEPTAGQRYASGAEIRIRWEAFNEEPFRNFEIIISDDNFVSFNVLHTSAPGEARELIWASAGPPGTTLRVRILAQTLSGAFTATDVSDPFIVDAEPAPGDLPWPWEENGDIGAVGPAGTATYAGGTFTLRGSGADIWDSADEFHHAMTSISGNFSLTARVTSVENVNRWTKAGIMIREGTSPSTRHALLLVTPTIERGVAFQRRPVAGGGSVHTPGPALTAPIWLKLVRNGDAIAAFYRKETRDAWTLIGQQVYSGLSHQLRGMLVISSHVDGRLAAATFDQVVVDEHEFITSSDIGATRPGTTSTDGATIAIEGGGADIWNSADAFRFHETLVVMDGSITVRVRSLETTHVWAKAGVMFRDTSHPSAPHVMAIVSPGRGVSLQYRDTLGGLSAEAARRDSTAPEWLRLTRRGHTFIADTSDDGVTWTTLGTVTIPMYLIVNAGLAVTSHAAGTLATAVFDDLVIRR